MALAVRRSSHVIQKLAGFEIPDEGTIELAGQDEHRRLDGTERVAQVDLPGLAAHPLHQHLRVPAAPRVINASRRDLPPVRQSHLRAFTTTRDLLSCPAAVPATWVPWPLQSIGSLSGTGVLPPV